MRPIPIRAASAKARRSQRRLGADFYQQRTLAVARGLIGLHLVRLEGGVRRVGRIVETEAYQGPADLAAHSARGRTARTEVMFGEPGHAYIYLIYGMWNCLNVVTGPLGTPHAVLLRALEPIANLDGKASGPGLLCRALHIDRTLNGVDLRRGELWLERPRGGLAPPAVIGRSARIGVDYAGDWATRPWRFFDRNSSALSKFAPAARRPARDVSPPL